MEQIMTTRGNKKLAFMEQITTIHETKLDRGTNKDHMGTKV
jgi:hypothetical protein